MKEHIIIIILHKNPNIWFRMRSKKRNVHFRFEPEKDQILRPRYRIFTCLINILWKVKTIILSYLLCVCLLELIRVVFVLQSI